MSTQAASSGYWPVYMYTEVTTESRSQAICVMQTKLSSIYKTNRQNYKYNIDVFVTFLAALECNSKVDYHNTLN